MLALPIPDVSVSSIVSDPSRANPGMDLACVEVGQLPICWKEESRRRRATGFEEETQAKMAAALRQIKTALRPLASTSTAALRSSSTRNGAASIGSNASRGLATAADESRTPAPMTGFKQTTVEELHSQTAHEALAGECTCSSGQQSGRTDRPCDSFHRVSDKKGQMRHFTGEPHRICRTSFAQAWTNMPSRPLIQSTSGTSPRDGEADLWRSGAKADALRLVLDNTTAALSIQLLTVCSDSFLS